MKKMLMKRAGVGSPRAKDLKKPFDFCCDINNQDPETKYDMRLPPFQSSLTNIAPNKDGPDLKFRIQDIGKPARPPPRGGAHKVKSATNMGRCKQSRGPLRWYIEEEISLARDLVANERKDAKRKQDQRRRERLARRRAKLKKRKERKNTEDDEKKDAEEMQEEGTK